MIPKFTVGVCGGGIGGLCLAVALSKFSNIQVNVYEATEQFKEIGAGVMIWGKTWHILELLGLAEEASRIAHAPPNSELGIGFDFRRSDQSTEGKRFHLMKMPYGCIRFHRAEFLDIFVKRLPKGVAHFRKRILTYRHEHGVSTGPISLHFSDGSSAICDILVGCDGIKSMVRAEMLQHMAMNGQSELLDIIDPIFSGTIAYRGLIPVDKIPKDAQGRPHRTLQSPMMYCGKSKHVVSYSISQGSIVNVVTFASDPEKEGTAYDGPWVTEVPKQELLDCYVNWEPEVTELLQCIERPTRWAIHQLKHLPTYVDGRVALLGDAAHAMTPHEGAGAGQAIEDAYVLAEIMGNSLVTLDTLPIALKAYNHIRVPQASLVLQGSRDAGRLYEFNGPQGENYNILGSTIQRQWDWIWSSTPEQDVANALTWMKAQMNQD